eukprot:527682-Prymnesium_polylepis.1
MAAHAQRPTGHALWRRKHAPILPLAATASLPRRRQPRRLLSMRWRAWDLPGRRRDPAGSLALDGPRDGPLHPLPYIWRSD